MSTSHASLPSRHLRKISKILIKCAQVFLAVHLSLSWNWFSKQN